MFTYRITYTAKTKKGEITGLEAWYNAEDAAGARRALLSDVDLKADISAVTGVPVSDITGIRIDRIVSYD